MGDVTDLSNFIGAVIDHRAFDRLSAALDPAQQPTRRDVLAGGKSDARQGYFVDPTLLVSDDPNHEIFTNRVLRADPGRLRLRGRRLLGCRSRWRRRAVRAHRRGNRPGPHAIAEATEHLRYAAGNFYVNDKPTGAVVGQQPFGGARASGPTTRRADVEPDPLGQPALIKETFAPPPTTATRTRAKGKGKESVGGGAGLKACYVVRREVSEVPQASADDDVEGGHVVDEQGLEANSADFEVGVQQPVRDQVEQAADQTDRDRRAALLRFLGRVVRHGHLRRTGPRSLPGNRPPSAGSSAAVARPWRRSRRRSRRSPSRPADRRPAHARRRRFSAGTACSLVSHDAETATTAIMSASNRSDVRCNRAR